MMTAEHWRRLPSAPLTFYSITSQSPLFFSNILTDVTHLKTLAHIFFLGEPSPIKAPTRLIFICSQSASQRVSDSGWLDSVIL